MRSFVPLFLTALLATVSALAAPAEGVTEVAARAILPVVERALPPTPVRRMTNAERLARGLPPAAPHRRSTPVRRQGGASPTPTVTYQATIQLRGTDGSSLGYISKNSDGGALYKTTTVASDALTVSFGLPVGQTSGDQLNVTPLNAVIHAGYSLIGPITPTAREVDMAAGSGNAAFFGNVGQTAPGAPAAVDGNTFTAASGTTTAAESAVWSINLSTNTISPRWVNSDGSTPALVYWISAGRLYLGGDPATWATTHHVAAPTIFTFELAFTPVAPA